MSDFEDELRKLQPGQPPEAWRAEILAKCERSVPMPLEEARSSWHEWLWPSPIAWGTLAAVWAILGILQASLSPSSTPDRTEQHASKVLAARREHQALLAQLR
jgi:hypothetical protein